MTIDTDHIRTPAGQPTGAGTVAGIALLASRWREGDALTAPGREPISYAELGRAAREIAGGLAELGIEGGDHVAILAGTRPEWTLADLGALSAGATVVPIYQTNSPEECEYILAHAGVRAVFCEDAAQVAKVDQVREALPGPRARHRVRRGGTRGIAAGRLRARGARRERRWSRSARARRPDDVATIVYTSGTTGPPKGCICTHASLLATVAMYVRELELQDSHMVIYLFLPLAHSLARDRAVRALEAGGTLAFWGGDPRDRRRARRDPPDALPVGSADLREGPLAVLTGSPSRAASSRRCSAGRSARAAGTRGRARRRVARPPGRRPPPDRGSACPLQGPRRVRRPTGHSRCTGAAPIAREVLEFFDACGVLVLEGYGMTETCAAATLNTPGAVRFGSVGRPLIGSRGGDRRGRRGPDGRSACVPGLLPRPEATAEPLETAGCVRATSASSTRTASCTSPAARRTSSSPRAGRTSRPRTSSAPCARRVGSPRPSWPGTGGRTSWRC